MFNSDQRDHMRSLSKIPPHKKCWCGWYMLGECKNNCPNDKTNMDKIIENEDVELLSYWLREMSKRCDERLK